MSERAQVVLETAIRCHIETGDPVSSRMIARRMPFKASAATVRNEMMDLVDAGYLMQSHASAGRVPTDRAYRHYANSIPEGKLPSGDDRAWIRNEYEDRTGDMEEIARATSRVLSTISNNAGVVMFSSPQSWTLKHIEFVQVSSTKILAVLLSPLGLCRTPVFSWEDTITSAELKRVNNYLNAHYTGYTLEQVIEQLGEAVEHERLKYHSLVTHALTLGIRALAATKNDMAEDIVLDGAEKVLEQPEFADVKKLKAVFRAFEEKRRLVRLLKRAIGD